MRYIKLKLIVVLIVTVFAAIAAFRPFETVSAQKTKTNILELASKYKMWERPVKPMVPQERPLESRPLPPASLITTVAVDTIQIDNSSGFG